MLPNIFILFIYLFINKIYSKFKSFVYLNSLFSAGNHYQLIVAICLKFVIIV